MQSLTHFVAADLSDILGKAGYASSHLDERLAYLSTHPTKVQAISVAMLEEYFQRNEHYVPDLSDPKAYDTYLNKVGIGGMEWHMRKYRPLTEALPNIAVLQCPRISLYQGEVGFLDGITRFTALRDAGFRTLVVQLPQEENVQECKALLGKELSTTLPLSFSLREAWHDVLHAALACMPYGTMLDGFTKVVNPQHLGFILSGSITADRLANELVWQKDDDVYTSHEVLQHVGGARLLHVAYHTLKEHLKAF